MILLPEAVLRYSVLRSSASESTHLDAIVLRLQHGIAFTQQVISGRFFDVKASLLNKSKQKLRSLNLHVGCMASVYRRSFYSRYVFTAEVILYQEQWKRVFAHVTCYLASFHASFIVFM